MPTAGDTLASIPASSLAAPRAIAAQNRCRCSLRARGGRPGDRIAGRPVTTAAHPGRRPTAHLLIKVLRRPVESTLTSRIGVVDQPLKATIGGLACVFTCPQRHLQRVERELGGHPCRATPPDDPPGVHIGDERGEHRPGPDRHVGQVHDPELVGPRRGEVPVDQVRGPPGLLVGPGGDRGLTAAHAAQPELAHQSLHGAARDRPAALAGDTVAAQLVPHLAGPVEPAALVPVEEGGLDRLGQRRVVQRSPRRTPLLVRVVAARSDRDALRAQGSTDRLDPEAALVLVDVGHDLRIWRSSSAAAKNADAVLRISFARRSSAFSRRSRLSSSDSAVVTPAARPSSMSACLHQPRNVSGRIPNCGPIRLHAALTESPGSCRRASRTMRWARSRISSLNFLGAGTISTFPWDQSLHHIRGGSLSQRPAAGRLTQRCWRRTPATGSSRCATSSREGKLKYVQRTQDPFAWA